MSSITLYTRWGYEDESNMISWSSQWSVGKVIRLAWFLELLERGLVKGDSTPMVLPHPLTQWREGLLGRVLVLAPSVLIKQARGAAACCHWWLCSFTTRRNQPCAYTLLQRNTLYHHRQLCFRHNIPSLCFYILLHCYGQDLCVSFQSSSLLLHNRWG